jgi:hypothetical protein
MLVFSFDAGSVNLGICVMEINTALNIQEMWRDLSRQFDCLVNHLKINQPDTSKLDQIKQVITSILQAARALQLQLSKMFVIKFVNTLDITAGIITRDKIERQSIYCARIKYILQSLEQFGRPDFVLIERQMAINVTAYAIHGYIENHYTTPAVFKIPLAIKEYLLSQPPSQPPGQPLGQPTRVVIMCSVLKNTIEFDRHMTYGDFVEKYTNKRANKNHATHQFKYWCRTWHLPITSRGKTDDSADAFLMIMAAWKRNKLI